MPNRKVPEPSDNRWLNAIVVQQAIMADSSDISPPKCPKCSTDNSIECDSYTEDGEIKYFCHKCNEQFTHNDPQLNIWDSVPAKIFRKAVEKID